MNRDHVTIRARTIQVRARGAVGALVGALSLLGAGAAPAQTGYTVSSDGDQHLYRVDLQTGVATDLGLLNFSDAEGLTFVGSTLYALGGSTTELWNITTTPGSPVGSTGPRMGADSGLSYNPVTSTMYNLNGDFFGLSASFLYSIDTATGAATFIGQSVVRADSLAINAAGQAFGADLPSDNLYSVNLLTAEMTVIGPLGIPGNFDNGMDFDSSGTLWMVTDGGSVYTVSTSTGAATLVAPLTFGGLPLLGCEGLGVAGEAPCYPDCNGVGGLTIADFGCFQTRFVAGDPYADCNGVGGLTIADFGCFQTAFVAGCP